MTQIFFSLMGTDLSNSGTLRDIAIWANVLDNNNKNTQVISLWNSLISKYSWATKLPQNLTIFNDLLSKKNL